MLKIEELESEILGIVNLLTKTEKISDVNKYRDELTNDIMVFARLKKDEILRNKENNNYLEIETIFTHTKPKTESNLKAICENRNISINDYLEFKNVKNYDEYMKILYKES